MQRFDICPLNRYSQRPATITSRWFDAASVATLHRSETLSLTNVPGRTLSDSEVLKGESKGMGGPP